MKNKFTSRTYESFFDELKATDEDRLMKNIDRYVDEYKEILIGLYIGDAPLEKDSEEIKNTILMTESPIERIFYVAAKNAMRKYGFEDGNGSFAINPQQKVEFGRKKYRVDFSFNYFDGFSKFVEIFVELNGHDYHNATKKKVTEDRKRERILQNKCDRVMTFTGTEIFSEADDCANEVYETLISIMKIKGIEKE